MNKINLYTNLKYLNCNLKALEFKKNDKYYSEILCLKEINNNTNQNTLKKSYESIKDHIYNSYPEIKDHYLNKLCVLQKNHHGKCTCNHHNTIFRDSKLLKKINKKITNSIYITPGNDDYVFKNRASRLYPIILSSDDEYLIKNKNKKLKCAIPLKEHSTPFMLASAYLDFLVFIINIKDMEHHININYEYFQVLQNHKIKLINYFGEHSRKIFDTNGNTMCPITHTTFKIDDLCNIDKYSPKPTDSQLGHIISRSDDGYTIFGFNIALMSRRGNSIIGEYSLLESLWINELKKIIGNN